MQKDANLVELEKCCQTHIFLQNYVLIQPRTSPLKICKILQNANFTDPNAAAMLAELAPGAEVRALCAAVPLQPAGHRQLRAYA